MPFNHARANLNELAFILNLEDVQFNENNTCILGIDDAFSLHLTYEPNTDRLYLYSPLLDGLPKTDKAKLKLYEMLLEASMLGGKMAGGGVGVAPEEGLILMHCTLDMAQPKPSALREFLPLFVARVEEWREQCKKICEFDKQIQLSSANEANSGPETTSSTSQSEDESELHKLLALFYFQEKHAQRNASVAMESRSFLQNENQARDRSRTSSTLLDSLSIFNNENVQTSPQDDEQPDVAHSSQPDLSCKNI